MLLAKFSSREFRQQKTQELCRHVFRLMAACMAVQFDESLLAIMTA